MEEKITNSCNDFPSFGQSIISEDNEAIEEHKFPILDEDVPMNEIDYEILYQSFISNKNAFCKHNENRKTSFIQTYKEENTNGYLLFILLTICSKNKKYFRCKNHPKKRKKKYYFECNFKATRISNEGNEYILKITHDHSRQCFQESLKRVDSHHLKEPFFDSKLVSDSILNFFRLKNSIRPIDAYDKLINKYPNLIVSYKMIENRLYKLRKANCVVKFVNMVRILIEGTTTKRFSSQRIPLAIQRN